MDSDFPIHELGYSESWTRLVRVSRRPELRPCTAGGRRGGPGDSDLNLKRLSDSLRPELTAKAPGSAAAIRARPIWRFGGRMPAKGAGPLQGPGARSGADAPAAEICGRRRRRRHGRGRNGEARAAFDFGECKNSWITR